MYETPPQIHACGKCLAVTLQCWAEGWLTTVDPVALDLRGQLAAREQGRMLYEIHFGAWSNRRSGGSYLVHRSAERIASGRPHIALAEHRCGDNLSAQDREAQGVLNGWLYPAPIRVAAEDLQPPF